MARYTPSKLILERYAKVLVRFALNGGKGLRKGEVVHLNAPEASRDLFIELRKEILKAGGHLIPNFLPDGTASRRSGTREFFELATPEQIDWFPEKYVRGLVDTIDHSIHILAHANPHELKGIDPKKIMRRGKVWKQFRDWESEKELRGKFSWTIALFGTEAMAKEAGLSHKAYWQQIIKACFLDKKDPIKEWRKMFALIEKTRAKLNAISHKIDKLHVVGVDIDLWITLGKNRTWLGGSGANIPSFEIFTSPDWRGTNGWIRFNQPLYRYGNRITGIELEFKNGTVVKARAKTNEKLLKEMIATPGADKIGEFSLTDRRTSRITKFMAETLYDENMGGPYGNTHIALGMAYKNTCTGALSDMTQEEFADLGFNDSSVHTDIISTAPRTVIAHMHDGSEVVLYTKGEFTL